MNRVSSIFSQMLRLVPEPLFQRAVCQHHGERHARGFRCWDQFVAMLFCQLGQSSPTRDRWDETADSGMRLIRVDR